VTVTTRALISQVTVFQVDDTSFERCLDFTIMKKITWDITIFHNTVSYLLQGCQWCGMRERSSFFYFIDCSSGGPGREGFILQNNKEEGFPVGYFTP